MSHLTTGYHRGPKPPRPRSKRNGIGGVPLLGYGVQHTRQKSHVVDEQHASSLFMAGFSAILYGGVAIAMNFVNKATIHQFPLASTLLLLQMLAAVVILHPLKLAGVVQMNRWDWGRAKALLPVTLLYTANTGFALAGLQALNIPMYNALKRLSPIIVLAMKAVMTRKLPSLGTTLSIVAGCVVAAIGDLSFDLRGYLYAMASCVLQASYLLLVEFSGAEKGISTAELLEYNAILSMPFLLGLIVVSGELWAIKTTFASALQTNAWFVLLVVACSVLGVLLNFSLFFCTTHNSALTTTVIGVLKGVVATILGFFLLGGVQFHVVNVMGIGMNMGGGVWYSVVKYREKSRKRSVDVPLLPISGSMDPLTAAESRAASTSSSFGSYGDLRAMGASGRQGESPFAPPR